MMKNMPTPDLGLTCAPGWTRVCNAVGKNKKNNVITMRLKEIV